MLDDHKRIYMLLELERIKEAKIPHVYVFPTAFLEFRCAIFKESVCIEFRLVKPEIEKCWSVIVDDLVDDPRLREIEATEFKFKNACETLEEVVFLVNEYSGVKVPRRRAKFSLFCTSNSVENRKRNFAALLLFVKDGCANNR